MISDHEDAMKNSKKRQLEYVPLLAERIINIFLLFSAFFSFKMIPCLCTNVLS